MNRTLLAILIILNIIVLALNAWMLYQHKQDREVWLQHMVAIQADLEKQSEQIETQVNSIGDRAASSMKSLQTLGGQTMDTMRPKIEKTAEELRRTSAEASELLNQNAQKAAQELRAAGEQILYTINQELENFNDNMKKDSGPQGSPQGNA